MESENISARQMRDAVKQSQSENTKIKFFNVFGKMLFEKGWSSQVTQQILSEICNQFGASHGMIAIKENATLDVLANIGQTYPVGARIPIMGSLAALLKPPCTFQINQQSSQLWTYQEASKENLLTPSIMAIAHAKQPLGILAFSRVKPSHLNEDMQTLQSICGLLGVAIMRSNSKVVNAEDLAVLEILTPREREIFALLPSGHSNAELGALLDIAPGTVKIHVERIFNKLGLRDRTQAAVKAVQLGFTP